MTKECIDAKPEKIARGDRYPLCTVEEPGYFQIRFQRLRAATGKHHKDSTVYTEVLIISSLTVWNTTRRDRIKRKLSKAKFSLESSLPCLK